MATCPNCGASSRDRLQNFEVTRVRTITEVPAAPEHRIGGPAFRVEVDETRLRLTHVECGWYIDGRIEGDSFVADEHPRSLRTGWQSGQPGCPDGCEGCACTMKRTCAHCASRHDLERA